MTIKNESGDTYFMSCIRCGERNDLQQIAHRIDGRMVGFVFCCGSCFKNVANGTLEFNKPKIVEP